MALIGARFDISVTDTRRRAARRFLYPYLVRDRMLLMERGVHLAYASCLRLHCFPFIIAALRTLMRRPRPSICFSLSLSFPPLFLSFIFHGRASRVLAPSIGSSAATSIITYISFVSIFSRHTLARTYSFPSAASLFFFFSHTFFPSLPLFSFDRTLFAVRAEHDGTPSIYFRSSAVARPPLVIFFYRGKSSRLSGREPFALGSFRLRYLLPRVPPRRVKQRHARRHARLETADCELRRDFYNRAEFTPCSMFYRLI